MEDYTVNLGLIDAGKKSFSFEVKDQFFEEYPFSDLQHVNISAIAKLDKDGNNLSLNLKIRGEIYQVACDICTEKLTINISGETDLLIKKNNTDLISTDEIIYINKNENKLDLKHLIFELIVLNVPKKRQHPLDKNGKSKCNKEMIKLVEKYTKAKKTASDPRWDALKHIT